MASFLFFCLLTLDFLSFWPSHPSFWPFGPSLLSFLPSHPLIPFIFAFSAFISFHFDPLGLHFISFHVDPLGLHFIFFHQACKIIGFVLLLAKQSCQNVLKTSGFQRLFPKLICKNCRNTRVFAHFGQASFQKSLKTRCFLRFLKITLAKRR